MDWNPVIQSLVQALVPVLMSAGVYAVIQIARHFGAKVTAEQEASINRVLFGAVQFAEEQSAKAAKDGRPMGSEQKLNLATQYAATQLGQVNPDVFRESIEAMLPISGKGATQPPPIGTVKTAGGQS